MMSHKSLATHTIWLDFSQKSSLSRVVLFCIFNTLIHIFRSSLMCLCNQWWTGRCIRALLMYISQLIEQVQAVVEWWAVITVQGSHGSQVLKLNKQRQLPHSNETWTRSIWLLVRVCIKNLFEIIKDHWWYLFSILRYFFLILNPTPKKDTMFSTTDRFNFIWKFELTNINRSFKP